MRYLLIILLFTSCITQKKVNRWLNEHPTKAAEYCSEKFPIKETTDTTYKVDSAAYNEAYNEVWRYADSLLSELERKPGEKIVYIDNGQYYEKPVNVDSIRKSISVQLRKSLKPCVDSIKVVTKVVENTAQIKYLNGRLEEKDATISKRDARITKLEAKVQAQKKWAWLFWGLIVLIAGLFVLKNYLKFQFPFFK